MLDGDSSVQFVRGIGPARAELLRKLGLSTVDDLLHHFPFRYEQDIGQVAIEDLVLGETATICGEVVRQRTSSRGARSCQVNDGTGICTLRWFRPEFADRRLAVGAIVRATGKVEERDGLAEIVHPRVDVYPPDSPVLAADSGARLIGTYRTTQGLPSQVIARAVAIVLAQPSLPVTDAVPANLRAARRLLPRDQAIRAMHAPRALADVDAARRTLAYEEFLLLELAMALRRRKRLALQVGRRLHVTAEIDARIRRRFPFTLTASQDAVIGEIARDVSSSRPMTRLLQGDVGSGKTVVAVYAALLAIANGCQAALMAPTEILAQQHFRNLTRYLDGSRVRCELLVGRQSQAKRRALLDEIAAGEVGFVVGTQALLEEKVAFADLAMVIVDEQHKFGVLQRAAIRTKGPTPHYLVMTATPIPRTLSMTVFGDLDVSVLREPPPGRGRVITKCVPFATMNTVLTYVRGRIESGEQAFVVCPLIGRGDESLSADDTPDAQAPPRAALSSATETYQRLVSGPWRDLPVGLLHGGLPAVEKSATMRAFAEGRLRALVATTVVEVGVDVPAATIIIVEHAERFGLSQLHQLRGRIARGARDGLCVLVHHGRGEKARQRLDVLVQTTDGFRIAEADLRLRGPGELFGTRQHGLPELRVGNLVADFELLERARADAFDIVAHDPELARPEHRPLLPALRRMLGDKLALIDAA
ncbi:MAG: ATP-dependent DNA helicase RecG [Phycisphaerae bacterium]|nr:ATP-dependent DNA helicase RecG [Phycisphaerae bacterium]